MLINLEYVYNKYNLDIKGVIHIGGHFGYEYNIYEKLKINNVVFFEPCKKSFEILKNNLLNKENCILINEALGNFYGEKELNVETANQGQSNSLLNPKQHLLDHSNIVFHTKEMVTVNKLDNYLCDFKDYYNFINIDVQGYELEVFKGASIFLNSIDYIITEINNVEMYENCVLSNDLDKYLLQYGFVRKETVMFNANWGDAFYCKNG